MEGVECFPMEKVWQPIATVPAHVELVTGAKLVAVSQGGRDRASTNSGRYGMVGWVGTASLAPR